MNPDQIAIFSLLGLVLGLLMWGRIRFDLIAFGALITAVALGVVPGDRAFSGFGHPATVIIALVLILSHGLTHSGAIHWISRAVIDHGRSISAHIAVMGGLGAALSAWMNNVAALTLLLPVELSASAKAKRSPGATLMPLSFATLLGGLITLIGTPPNIIISGFRAEAVGEPFRMFDFTPVGLTVAVAGVTFIALIGWRLIPKRATRSDRLEELRRISDYIVELSVPESSFAVGKLVMELDEAAEAADAVLLGLVRNGRRLPGRARTNIIRPGDLLIAEVTPGGIEHLKSELKLELVGHDLAPQASADNLSQMEVVVDAHSPLIGRSAVSFRLTRRHGVVLLGISRRGQRIAGLVRQERIEAGDTLLLIGSTDQLANIDEALGVISLAPQTVQPARPARAGFAAGIFFAAIIAAAFGLSSLPATLAFAVVLYVVLGIVPAKDFYKGIEWPVIILVGSLIPLGEAFETTGASGIVVNLLLGTATDVSPVLLLLLMMLLTMRVTDLLNNAATALIMAPVAIEASERIGASPDPFLMAVAIAASCDFLTPIGHQNNTLVMGPGGYRFGDYWRMGLPLEIVVLAVAIPMILIVWPF